MINQKNHSILGFLQNSKFEFYVFTVLIKTNDDRFSEPGRYFVIPGSDLGAELCFAQSVQRSEHAPS
jgi:hypothetical protein